MDKYEKLLEELNVRMSKDHKDYASCQEALQALVLGLKNYDDCVEWVKKSYALLNDSVGGRAWIQNYADKEVVGVFDLYNQLFTIFSQKISKDALKFKKAIPTKLTIANLVKQQKKT